MKRLHIGLKVDDIETGVDFYTRLFGAKPTLQRGDYAKWMLDDPRVNFSIDTHGDGPAGSAHYGIQLETMAELERSRDHVDSAALPRTDQNNLVCGYQRQHKSWISDPDGLKWEFFYTEGIANEGYGCGDTPAMP